MRNETFRKRVDLRPLVAGLATERRRGQPQFGVDRFVQPEAGKFLSEDVITLPDDRTEGDADRVAARSPNEQDYGSSVGSVAGEVTLT